MLFNTVTIVALLATVAQAQSIGDLVGQIPTCAVSCLTSAITSAGCSITDYVCQCTTGHDTILANGSGCIQSACSTSDALTTTDITNKICALATAGGAGSSSAASAANSATSAAASAASSAANAASSSIATLLSSAASAASASATAAASASASASASAAASSAATKASASASATTTPNAGNSLKVGASILGAVVMAALAL